MSTPEEIKRTIIDALNLYRGDDATRARRAFHGFSDVQMGEQHGNSGSTRQEVLEAYEAHERRVNTAINWVVNVAGYMS